MTFRIDYEARIQEAFRKAIRKILLDVSNKGLPGKHHFYISFRSTFPGVQMSEWLIEKYPDDMTIVIQNWFAELVVGEQEFSIILNFNNSPEKMTIPLSAITNFSDPSVNFSLQLELFEYDKANQKSEKDNKPLSQLELRKEKDKDPGPESDQEGTKKKSSDGKKVKGNIIDFQSFRKPD